MASPTWPQVGIFTRDFDALSNLIPFCQDHDLTAVQLDGPLLEQALTDPVYAAKIRQQMEAHGIKIVALGGYRNLVAPDEEKRKDNLAYLKECLRLAPLLGTSIVATGTGTFATENDWVASPANQTPVVREYFYTAIDELLSVAEQYGVILALEGASKNVVNTLDALSETLSRFSISHLQVVLDPFNYLSRDLLPQSEQVVNEFFNRFEQRFVVAHLKDVSAAGAEAGTPEFGCGVFSYQPYFAFLKHRRPDLPLILEHLPIEHIPAALARLRESIQSLI
jgi:Sugar phosphate isomerases/epimerases